MKAEERIRILENSYSEVFKQIHQDLELLREEVQKMKKDLYFGYESA